MSGLKMDFFLWTNGYINIGEASEDFLMYFFLFFTTKLINSKKRK